MAAKKWITIIRNLIAEDKLQDALQQIRKLLDNSSLLDEAILQSARWHDIRRHIRVGTIKPLEAALTQNQIRAGLLDLLREIEKQEENPAIREEIEKHAAGMNIIQNADKIYNIDQIDNANFS